MKKALLYWAPVALYMALVLHLSTMPETYEPLEFQFRDKVYHFGAYLIMGFLWARGLRAGSLFKNRIVLGAFFISFLYGAAIEGVQSFTPNRLPEAADAIANGAGALAGAYVFNFFSGLMDKGKEGRCS